MSLLDDIKNKIGQFGSDVANGTTDAFDAAKNGVQAVFNTGPPKASVAAVPKPVTPAPITNAASLTRLQAPGTIPIAHTPGAPAASPIDPNPTHIDSASLAKTLMTPVTGTKKAAIGLAQGTLRSVPEVIASIRNKPVNNSNPVTKTLFGAAPEQPIEQTAEGVYRANENRKTSDLLGHGKIEAGALAVGDVLMHLAQDVPVVGGLAKGGSVAAKAASGAIDTQKVIEAVKAGRVQDARSLLKGGKEAPPPPEEVPAEKPSAPRPAGKLPVANADTPEEEAFYGPRNADAERAAIEEMHNSGDYDQAVLRYADTAKVDTMTAVAHTNRALEEAGIMPTGGEAAPIGRIKIPDGAPPKTAKAAENLVDTYLHNGSEGATSADDLLRKAGGKSEEFAQRSEQLERAMKQELTPVERQTVRDNLEGDADPKLVTPKVQAVTQIARQLNDIGHSVLDTAKPTGASRVKNYATRLARSGLSKGSNNIEIKLNQVRDLFNTDSRFNQHRQVGKFVADDGTTKYGTQTSAGLTKRDGQLVDSSGKVFTPRAVSTKELNDSGVIKYENDYGKIANEYHTHIGKVKARYDALNQLLRNPEKFGISDVEEPGYTEIHGVPELEGKFARADVANKIEQTFKGPDARKAFERIWQGASNTIVQFIVANPLFHGRNLNQLAGMAAGKVSQIGPAELKASYVNLATKGAEYREALTTRLLRAGGGLEHYGAQGRSVLTNALDKVDLPHFNKANAVAMEKIDTSIRLSLFDLLTRHSMSDEEAARTIDQFMGDRQAGNSISKYVGLFWNYTRTQARALSQVKDPGVAIAFAEQAAVHFGVQKAFQEWTGNQNAKTGNPGVFGAVNDLNKIRQGQVGAVAADKLNPLITTGINQATDTELYNQQKITGGPKGRLENAGSTLISPSQYATKVNSGKASPGQEALQFATGATLPHAKNAPAAPNFKSGPLSIVNTKGAKPVKIGGDPTGIKQQTQYFNAVDKAQKTLDNSQSTRSLSTFNDYISRNHDASGATIQLSPKESMNQWGNLAGDSKVLNAVSSINKSQPDHNPVWDLSGNGTMIDKNGNKSSESKLQVYAQYESEPNGSADRTQLEQLNPWLAPEFTKEQDWFNNADITTTALPYNGPLPGGVTLEDLKYPEISPQQNDMLAQASTLSSIPAANRTAEQEAQLTQLESQLQPAYQALDKYTNAQRVAKGYSPLNFGPDESPAVTEGLTAYDALPTGDGSRSAWIQSHPDLWTQIQNYFEQSSLAQAEKGGALAQLEGDTPSQSFLGAVSSLGNYDIASQKNANGTSSYALDPATKYAQDQASSQNKPLVPLPKFPKKHTVSVKSLKRVSPKRLKVRAGKNGRIHIQSSGVLHKTKVGNPTHVVHIKT